MLTDPGRRELSRLLGGTAGEFLPADTSGGTVVNEAEPARFRQAFAAAVARSGTVFLSDPQWREDERSQFRALLDQAGVEGAVRENDRGWLAIPTGGSSGSIKLACHDGATLAAAVDGFVRHFGVARINAFNVLPLYHVSGLMAWMRTALTGGRLETIDWKTLQNGSLPTVPEGEWFLSLVPTQLQRLLRRSATRDWLRRFRAVFLGGGPSWPSLLAEADAGRVPLSLSYGMTETAAMVTALRPEEFSTGLRSAGLPLPHARVTLARDGRIVIEGPSLHRGYFPLREERPFLVTNDLGMFDSEGRLTILGRADDLIISGGEKIDPLQVEAVLHATGQFADVAVLGLPDPEWGQAVVACYAPREAGPDWNVVQAALERELSRHKRPRRFVSVVPWPRTPQGKLNRAALRQAASG